jgi:hypothetical protein
MPEYILDMGSPEGARAYNTLDSFTQGYIEAALFCGVERKENDPEKDHDKDYDAAFCELTPETVEEMAADCKRFQEMYPELLDKAYATGYEPVQAGRDFWFTRNGHGVGYWDRKELEADGIGDALSDCCGHDTEFTEYDLMRNDDDTVSCM